MVRMYTQTHISPTGPPPPTKPNPTQRNPLRSSSTPALSALGPALGPAAGAGGSSRGKAAAYLLEHKELLQVRVRVFVCIHLN